MLAIVLLIASSAFGQIKLVENVNLNGLKLNGKPVMFDVTGNIWTTDGTPGGTAICTNKVKLPANNQGILANNKIYFAGDADAYGNELWCTDGTDTGTYLVKDITPGTAGTIIGDFFVQGNNVCFFAGDLLHGYELWVTDGTSVGTKLLKDITPGPQSSTPGMLWNSTASLDSITLFPVQDIMRGFSIWKTDGTDSGTVLLKEIFPNNFTLGSQTGNVLVKLGNLIMFTADDGSHGRELWRTDGTPDGTFMVKDILENEANGVGTEMVVFQNKVYFEAYTESNAVELWSSDGTLKGTQRVAAMPPAEDFNAIYLYSAIAFPDKLLFNYYRGSTGELWTTDGTDTGTKKLTAIEDIQNINILTNYDGGQDAVHLPPFQGKVFVSTGDVDGIGKLWLTDGTDNGTTLIASGGGWESYAYGASQFYFWADHQAGPQQQTLYKTDGTAASTKDIHSFPRPTFFSMNNYPHAIFELNNEFYYAANDNIDSSGKNDIFRTGTLVQASGIFTFTGNGEWGDTANWLNSQKPPQNLTIGEIIIDHTVGGECVLSSPQVISSGARLTIKENKQLRVVN